ncbi:hypothetical protein CLI64_07290 [Nostoc sp. CENA543]|uniref:hypothetical protein n=1 Tax=Nostoc sp. CENA543 TaxID=1869241 RepID=UPI000CA091F5|nr:hypothetical protein [Nostoc sp. CENA543]AUT00199.1 hypothetical protein CLI64_07290 [Nostoc sp. CENA543]
MGKIKIYDLFPENEDKFIQELSSWEMKGIYAGSEPRYGYGRRPPVQEEEPTSVTVADANNTLDRWLNNLELQIQDLRRQLGVPR